MPYDIIYMWSLKYDTNENELIQEGETDSGIGNRLVFVKREGGWGRDGLGVWDQQMQTIINKMDKQQGPAVQHRGPYSTSWDRL